jgi:hypothetical protein
VLIGNPINLGLAAALVFAAGAFAAAQMLLAVTAITSVLGASLIGAHTPRQVRPIRVVVDA